MTNPANTVTRVTLSGGTHGVDETIDAMAKISMGEYGAASVKIRNCALDIVRAANVQEKDQLGEVTAIHQWVMDHLRYVRDPYGVEFITYPETLAFERQDGDCDDHVILEAALLGSIGIPTHFVTVGFKNQPFSHVYLGAVVGGRFIPLDPIVKNKPVGWEAPDPTSKKVYPPNDARGTMYKNGTAGVELLLMGIAFFAWLRGK
jgi:hypothetical protein